MVNGVDAPAFAGSGLVLLGIDDGKVKMIKSNLDWLVLDPVNALAIGEELARLSWELMGKPRAEAGKSTIAQIVIDKMQVRAAHVMRDLYERNRSWDYIAKEIVNIVAAEIAA